MRVLITLALLALVKAGSAQIYFNKQIDWEKDFEYYAGISAFDSSKKLLLAGGNQLLYPQNSAFFLTLINSSGDIIWNKSLKLGDTIIGNAFTILAIDSLRALMAGNAYIFRSDSTVDLQIFLIGLDYQTGGTIWVRQYGKPAWHETGWHIIPTQDQGYAVVGGTFPIDESLYSKILFIKVDSLGNQTFRKEYTTNSNRNHFGWALTQTPGGGYLLVCDNFYEGICIGCNVHSNISEIVLIKTDAQGNQQWVKKITPYEWKQLEFAAKDIQLLSDGTFLLCGFKDYLLLNQVYTYYLKHMFFHIGANGSILDSISIDGGADGTLERMIPVSDGNFLAMGFERDSSFGVIGQKGLLLKITPDLKLLWKREYRVSPVKSRIHEKFYDAVEMPDKGFVVCGRAFGPLEDSTNQNGWVIRVDSLGCLEPGCDTLYTAVHDPPNGEASDSIGVSVYPNPTAERFTVAVQNGGVLLGVKLFGLDGQLLEDVQFLRAAGVRAAAFSLASRPAGGYGVLVRTDRRWVMKKIVKN